MGGILSGRASSLSRSARLGQAGIACPTFHGQGFSRDALDAHHGRSRAHLRDDHDDQILDRDCLDEYHACRFLYPSDLRAILLAKLLRVCRL